MFARDTAEREERKRKEIHDQARQEVETEFALKAAMHENLMQKIREELRQEQEHKAVEETERKAKVREMMQQEAIRLRSLYGFEARASPQPPWEYHTPHNFKEDSEGDEDSDFYTSARASPMQPDDTAEERWNDAEKDDSGGDDKGNIDWPTMPLFGHEGPITISNGSKEEIEQEAPFSLPNHQGTLPILPHGHQIDLKTALAADLRQARVQQRPGKSKNMFPPNGVADPASPMIQLSDDYPYTSNDGNQDCRFAEGFRGSTSPVRYPYLPKPSGLSLGGQSFGSLQQKQPSTTHVPMVPVVFWAMTPVRFEVRSTTPPAPRPQEQREPARFLLKTDILGLEKKFKTASWKCTDE
ncbi:hypothetical protein CSHISOI_07783 [Colletotrichum shisoi]|uniref:Uncharacterized protein n=1 Tax=Colletotrichum shisoi TaxID=2078593 RepID=A0A5Q4BMC3_9PEZI|nr:hypothetical protein CSHISOI_07783 [Colletotrichum shisoi]